MRGSGSMCLLSQFILASRQWGRSTLQDIDPSSRTMSGRVAGERTKNRSLSQASLYSGDRFPAMRRPVVRFAHSRRAKTMVPGSNLKVTTSKNTTRRKQHAMHRTITLLLYGGNLAHCMRDRRSRCLDHFTLACTGMALPNLWRQVLFAPGHPAWRGSPPVRTHRRATSCALAPRWAPIAPGLAGARLHDG